MSKTKSVKLDDTTHKRLAALARIRDRSPHWLMRKAIETFLDSEENYEREEREDMERWERYQLTCEAIPHEKAAAWIENLARGKVTSCPMLHP
jgi:predicted transcriptional regulator